MNYFEKKKIHDAIKIDIVDITEYDDVEDYIQANFQQFLRNGEYDDNSLDLDYNYRMLKKITEDVEFEAKLNFVLSRYIKYSYKS